MKSLHYFSLFLSGATATATNVAIQCSVAGNSRIAGAAGGIAALLALSAMEISNRANRNPAPTTPEKGNNQDTKPKPEP